jgi:hypothetical protein
LKQSAHLKEIQSALQADPDSDKDGMPDLWETWFFDSPADATAASDADADGSPDQDEYVAGTDPVDAQSVFAINGAGMVSGNQVKIRWNSVADRAYTVQFSTNLLSGTWMPVIENITAMTSKMAVTSSASTVEGFYRVRVQQ